MLTCQAMRGESWAWWSGAKAVTCILTRSPSIRVTIRNGCVSSSRCGKHSVTSQESVRSRRWDAMPLALFGPALATFAFFKPK